MRSRIPGNGETRTFKPWEYELNVEEVDLRNSTVQPKASANRNNLFKYLDIYYLTNIFSSFLSSCDEYVKHI